VFFLEPNPTPYDLRWQMFGISVRVHPVFWLVGALTGWNALELGFQYLLIWIACFFVSILIHELGHVWMGLAFGSHGHIVLYGFGGLAIGSNDLAKRWQRIAVCFAGPLAGFLLLGLLFLLLWLRDPEIFPVWVTIAKSDLGLPVDLVELRAQVRHIVFNPLEFFIVSQMIFINLLWGLVNLLPIWPLDGGQISRDVCEGVSRDRGFTWSLGISLVLAGLLAIHSLMAEYGQPLIPFLRFGSTFSAILFGLLALQSFQLLQHVQSQRRWLDDHWDRGDWR
jgi:stage IV sporulation protein FB